MMIRPRMIIIRILVKKFMEDLETVNDNSKR